MIIKNFKATFLKLFLPNNIRRSDSGFTPLISVLITHVVEVLPLFISVIKEINEVVVPNPFYFSFKLLHGIEFQCLHCPN